MNLQIHLTKSGELGLDPDQLADYLRPGAASGPTGPVVARAAKIRLHDPIRPLGMMHGGLILLADAPAFRTALFQEDAKAADTRSRYQRFLDNRAAARRQRLVDAQTAEQEAYRREPVAMQQGLHEAWKAGNPVGSEKVPPRIVVDDPDFGQWQQEGEPERGLPDLGPHTRDVAVGDEGEILR